MPFVKVVKNKAYFKRFQVNYKRRREGKTDFRARRQMVLQDKTKFDAPKYRLVARVTGSDIVAQIVHSKAGGDHVVMAAYSHELPAFGVSVGLTNYAAAYATGLLVARRLLTKLGIADKFPGAKEATGDYTKARVKGEDEDDKQFPFKAILDVGLARTTTGARVFGVLKGAVDGGIAVPHKPNRFPGFKREKKELDTKAHRARILGLHVADYLKKTIAHNAENPDEKTSQFSKFVKAGLKPTDIEAMYKKLHAAIRATPTKKVEKKKAPAKGGARKSFGAKRLTHKERTAAAQKKVATLRAQLKK